MKGGSLRSTVVRGNADQNVLPIAFCIFDEHIKIAVLAEDTRVEQLKLRISAPTFLIFLKQPQVGKLGLRVFIQHAHVAMRGGGVQIEILFFYILAMIALVAGESV